MKIRALLIAMLLVFPAALAQEEETAGIAPDSVFYGLDKALDRISLALTMGKAAKAEKGLKIAQERLMEAKLMAEQDKVELAAEAEAEHEAAVDGAAEAAEEVETNGDVEKAKESLQEVAKLQNAAESHYEKVAAVKDAILERQKERMSEEQYAKLEAVFNKIKEKAKAMEGKTHEKKEKVKVKYKALAGATDEEVEEVEVEADKIAGLVEGRKDRAEKEMEKAKKALEKAKEKLKENNISSEKLKEAEQELEKVKKLTDKNKAEIAEKIKELGNEVSSLATTLGEAKKSGDFTEALNQLKETIRERNEEVKAKIELKDLKSKVKVKIADEQTEIESEVGNSGSKKSN